VEGKESFCKLGEGYVCICSEKADQAGRDRDQPSDVSIGVVVQLQHIHVVVGNGSDGGKHGSWPVLFVVES